VTACEQGGGKGGTGRGEGQCGRGSAGCAGGRLQQSVELHIKLQAAVLGRQGGGLGRRIEGMRTACKAGHRTQLACACQQHTDEHSRAAWHAAAPHLQASVAATHCRRRTTVCRPLALYLTPGGS
jgi:hypothetical protein